MLVCVALIRLVVTGMCHFSDIIYIELKHFSNHTTIFYMLRCIVGLFVIQKDDKPKFSLKCKENPRSFLHSK